jgi:hypothetical protein
MTADCLKLLHHQQRRHRLALTLPFLVGALRRPVGTPFEGDEDAWTALATLLAQLRDAVQEESEYVRVFRCPDLRQPVASITKTYYYAGHAKWGVPKPTTKIFFEPPYRPEPPEDVAAAAKLLWPVVSLAVLGGRFAYSKSANRYEPFGAAERQFISDALGYDEDNQL